MWTLSLPRVLRLALVRREELLPIIQKSLIQAIGCWQRRRLRPDMKSPRLENGALVFVQLFGGSLHLTPHLHVLVPEALWEREGQRVAVPSPAEDDIEGILRRLLRELRRKFRDTDFTEYPEDGYEEAQVEAIQQALPLKLQGIEVPRARKPMVAVIEGFSLHVGRRIHENDRGG
jgi:hypothetical protein